MKAAKEAVATVAVATANWAGRTRKFLAAAAGVGAQVLALNVLPPDVARIVSIAVAVITSLLVYWLPNGDTVARQTSSGELVAGEAAPLPAGTPVEVTLTPTESGPRHLAPDDAPTRPPG